MLGDLDLIHMARDCGVTKGHHHHHPDGGDNNKGGAAAVTAASAVAAESRGLGRVSLDSAMSVSTTASAPLPAFSSAAGSPPLSSSWSSAHWPGSPRGAAAGGLLMRQLSVPAPGGAAMASSLPASLPVDIPARGGAAAAGAAAASAAAARRVSADFTAAARANGGGGANGGGDYGRHLLRRHSLGAPPGASYGGGALDAAGIGAPSPFAAAAATLGAESGGGAVGARPRALALARSLSRGLSESLRFD